MHARPMGMARTALAGVIMVLVACTGPTGSPVTSIGEVQTFQPSPTSSASGPGLPPLPAGFPLMAGMQTDGPPPGEPGLIGRWTTSASGAEVYAFLESALPGAGYRVDLLAPGDSAAVIRFTPPGGEQLQVDLGQEGSGTFMELRLPRD